MIAQKSNSFERFWKELKRRKLVFDARRGMIWLFSNSKSRIYVNKNI
jgi:hypothetical protein